MSIISYLLYPVQWTLTVSVKLTVLTFLYPFPVYLDLFSILSALMVKFPPAFIFPASLTRCEAVNVISSLDSIAAPNLFKI